MANNEIEANFNDSSTNVYINTPKEGENEIELQDLNPGAVEEEPEPEKIRSKLRLIAVLAGLNVGPPHFPLLRPRLTVSLACNVYFST